MRVKHGGRGGGIRALSDYRVYTRRKEEGGRRKKFADERERERE